MLLNELVGVRKFFDLSLDELIFAFVKHSGYKNLGKGFFAYVFKNPKKPDEVIKFWVNDPAYEKFVSYAEKHQDNPCLPKLKGKIKTISSFHKRLVGFPEKIKYIRMELLSKVEESYYNFAAIEKNVERYMKDPNSIRVPDPILELVQTLADISKTLNISTDEFDVNNTNIMMRGKQFVITDPFADGESIDIMHELHRYSDPNEIDNPKMKEFVVKGKT
jgi:hypothetical protein